MTPEEAAKWLDSWTAAGATSGKFAEIADLIRAQDAEISRLRAEVERLTEQVAARDKAIEVAFEAIAAHMDAYHGHTSDCGSWDGHTATACDCGWLDAYNLSVEARRLKAELEGK